MGTLFSTVYNRFLGKITDDMYVELTPEDTLRDLQNLLIDAIPAFEFPRKDLDSYTIETAEIATIEVAATDFVTQTDEQTSTSEVDRSAFTADLTDEEINILAIEMQTSWLKRQIASIENTRMKYSGADFKFTSQANHLSKLLSLADECRRDSMHKQRLYKRRRKGDNGYESNWSVLREVSTFDD